MYSYLHSSGLTGSAGSSRDPPLGVRGDLMLELSEGALLARLGLSLGCGGGWALFLPRCISRPVPSCPGNVLSHSSLMYYCSKISYNSSKPTVLANYLGNVKQWGGGSCCIVHNTIPQGCRDPGRLSGSTQHGEALGAPTNAPTLSIWGRLYILFRPLSRVVHQSGKSRPEHLTALSLVCWVRQQNMSVEPCAPLGSPSLCM